MDNPVTNYNTQEDELIARIPHSNTIGATVDYKADNQIVWHYIYEATKYKSCFTHRKRFQRAKDGMAAYVALKHHYVGENHVNQQALAAEGMLQNTIYAGRNWFTFEHYCTLHSQQYEILCGLQAHGNSGIDEASKVRYLNNGIKDTALEGAI